jgi:hypothetical protein
MKRHFFNKRPQSGFIALVSVIFVAFMLVTFAISVGLTGYYGRANQLLGEVKEQSAASANACAEKAIADLASERVATGTLTFGDDLFVCTVKSIALDTPTSGQTTIKAEGVYKESYTNLVVVVDSTTQAVLSWREYAVMP